MTKLSIASISLAAVVCVLSAGIALADATVTFPSSNSLYSTAGNGTGLMGANGDQSAPLYMAGDSISETFFTAQPTVNSLALTLQLVNYFGNNPGANYENDIYVNGVNVANFLVSDCGFCASIQTFTVPTTNFSPIHGGIYQLEIILADTVPSNGGAEWFISGGSATLVGVAVPEPYSLVLLASGVLGVLGRRWRAGL